MMIVTNRHQVHVQHVYSYILQINLADGEKTDNFDPETSR